METCLLNTEYLVYYTTNLPSPIYTQIKDEMDYLMLKDILKQYSSAFFADLALIGISQEQPTEPITDDDKALIINCVTHYQKVDNDVQYQTTII